MDKVKLLCVGRVKEASLEPLVNEYVKRITGFIPFSVFELKEPKGSRADAEDPALIEQFKKYMSPKDHLVALDVLGEKRSSVQFAQWLQGQFTYTQNPLVFVIGGAMGLPTEVRNRCQSKLSFSDMTMPHDLFRVVFLEQLYRAMTIIHNRPYHK